MNIFVCFTGQGSQKSQMCLDFLQNPKYSKITNEIFEKSNQILGYQISEIILNSSLNNELNQTINTQPAIGINAEIIWNIFLKNLQEKNINLKEKISFFAGHSVGEYNALCAAGFFDFKTKIKLLYQRALLMQDASSNVKSGMIAILGSQISEIEKIIERILFEKNLKLEIANDNGAEQIVLSGRIESIDFLEKNYKDFQIKKAIKLNVSGAFHSSLMLDAEKNFAQKINEILIDDNQFQEEFFESQKVISNVTTEFYNKSNQSEMKKLLCMQITSRVKWRETMDFIFKKGITKILEIGPSPTLINLAKKHFSKIDPNKDLINFCISNVESMENFFSNEYKNFIN